MEGSLPVELLDAIDRLGFSPWSGLTYRHTAPGRNGLSGVGARLYGGRWNPPNLVSTIYLARPRAACIGEFHRMAQGQGRGPESFLPRTIHHVEVIGLPVLDLTAGGLARVGLDSEDIRADDWSASQLVGEVANFLGAGGVLAPSATELGLTLAVFEHRGHGYLRVIASDEMRSDEAVRPLPAGHKS